MPFPEKVKREAKERAHYHCLLCQTPFFVEVHHIIPESEEGPDTLDNAAPLCPSCHQWFGHDPAKRTEIRARRDWWWERCAKIDAAQMTPPVGRRFDELFQRYQESEAQQRERLLNDMKAFIAQQLREQMSDISSAHTLPELVQASVDPFIRAMVRAGSATRVTASSRIVGPMAPVSAGSGQYTMQAPPFVNCAVCGKPITGLLNIDFVVRSSDSAPVHKSCHSTG